MKKKKVVIVLISIFIVISVLIGLYFYGLTPVSKTSTDVEFIVTSGKGKIEIIDDLKSAGLLKSKFASYIYVGLHGTNLQAGKYSLNASMSTKEIINKIGNGEIIEEKNTFMLTFIEGKRIPIYAGVIAEATGTTKEEVLKILSDKEYLKSLIDEYWFLTEDILNEKIYYPLEGYLFPNTYEFYKGSSIKDIVKRLLNEMNNQLTPLKSEIESSNFNVHELLTLASIVELEGANSDDRAGVAGVFYNRLKIGDSLGSDVTTYYGVKVELSERDLYQAEIDNCNNGYNTRFPCNPGKLPIGPIASVSATSIKATINPEVHDYLFFVADKYKHTYFTKTNWEHNQKVIELKNSGLWYEYR